jgi:hypothetical protein
MKTVFSIFLGCASAVLAQNPQAKQEPPAKQEPRAKQENAPPQPVSFFVTSVGVGKDADLPWYNQKGHPSRGCGQENLVSTGGAGLYYCFAVIP